jgi:hypothetical protein
MSEGTSRSYNNVYEHLVESDDDVLGLVAYALYKQHKRDWLVSLRRGRPDAPTSDQLDAFVQANLTVGQRERLRMAARSILDAYALAAVNAERPHIVHNAIQGRIEEAAKRVENAGAWWRQMPAGIISAFVYTLLLILLAFVLRYAGIDLLSVLANVGRGS